MQATRPSLARSIRAAYSLAQDIFTDYDIYLHTSQQHAVAFHAERLEAAVQELASKLLAAFEFLGVRETSRRFTRAVESLSASDLTYDDEAGGLYSIPLDVIRPYVEIVEALAGRTEAVETN